MIKVFYTSFNKRLEEPAFYNYLSLLPSKIQQKILRFRFWKDQHASLLGKLLLIEGLQDLNVEYKLDDLLYSENYRPYFCKEFDFNISHSDEVVACAFSTGGMVGLDVEKVVPIELEDFRQQFSIVEWTDINSSLNKHHQFYKYWTIKEAVIKADGKGLSIPLTELKIMEDVVHCRNKKWFTKEIKIQDKYQCHIATSNFVSEITTEKVAF